MCMLAGEAKELVEKFPIFARKNDEVLMAMAKTFPSGLNYWERFIYPCKFLMSYLEMDIFVLYFSF